MIIVKYLFVNVVLAMKMKNNGNKYNKVVRLA